MHIFTKGLYVLIQLEFTICYSFPCNLRFQIQLSECKPYTRHYLRKFCCNVYNNSVVLAGGTGFSRAIGIRVLVKDQMTTEDIKQRLLEQDYNENCPGCKVDRRKVLQQGVPYREVLIIWVVTLASGKVTVYVQIIIGIFLAILVC